MYKLREHQEDYVNMLLSPSNANLGGLMAWHGMGLGKTLSTLDASWKILTKLRSQGVQSPKTLIIMPKSAHSTWQTECHKFTPYQYRDLLLLPYSQLHKAVKLSAYYDIRVIALDESHYIKNPTTGRAKDLASLLTAIGQSTGGFKGGRILPLSGTPMLNSGADWYTTWALLSTSNLVEAANRLIDEKKFDAWKKSFSQKKENTWFTRNGEQSGSDYKGVANDDLLTQLLAPIVHFRRVSDCIDLPEKEEIPIDLNLPDDKLLADANIEEPEHYMALLERLSQAKTPYMLEWVKDFKKTTNEQLVVFSQYKHPIEQLRESVKGVVVISGEESTKDRRNAIAGFQSGKYQIIALTYGSGAESLNFQNAHNTLYNGYPWTDGKLKQAMARTYRQNQKNFTKHYFLTSGHNDMRILRLVREKEEATSTVESNLLRSYQSENYAPTGLDTFL